MNGDAVLKAMTFLVGSIYSSNMVYECTADSSFPAYLLSSTPPGTYSADIPQYLQTIAQQSPEAAAVTAQQHQITQPPSLPPHLEKVMLNSQTVSDEDNSVLPVPNHVTLNHLYACSIKDGVMALAATSRYRKKVRGRMLNVWCDW